MGSPDVSLVKSEPVDPSTLVVDTMAYWLALPLKYVVVQAIADWLRDTARSLCPLWAEPKSEEPTNPVVAGSAAGANCWFSTPASALMRRSSWREVEPVAGIDGGPVLVWVAVTSYVAV